MFIRKKMAALAAAGMGLALAACGGGGSDSAPAGGGGGGGGTVTLGGVAAVGAPIVDGTVTLACSSAVSTPTTTTTTTTTTSATGSWQVDLPADALPCALQLSGGTAGGSANLLTLHSFAQSGSTTVNITPLTDLMLALATGGTPSAWFGSAGSASLASTASSLAAAQTQLLQSLAGAGYTVPVDLDAFATAFTAASGNAYDDLLEALGAGLQAASQSYAALLASAGQGGTFTLPAAAAPGGSSPPPANAGTITPPPALAFTAASTDAEFLGAIVGTHQVMVYRAPEAGQTGPATLTVAYDGSRLTHTLHLNAGNVLIHASAPLVDKTAEASGGLQLRWLDKTEKYPFAPAGGRDLSVWNYYNEGLGGGSLRIAYLPDGRIYGEAGTFAFRNGILSGAAVPAVLTQLAGATFVGRSRLCHDDAKPLTASIGSGGAVTLTGRGGPISFSGVACDDMTVTNTWDGVDDLIEWRPAGGSVGLGAGTGPDPATAYAGTAHANGVWLLQLDSAKGHGSMPGGGIKMHLSSLDETAQILWIYTGVSGAHSGIDTDDQPALVRQP